jgi:hypothetical protein
VERNYKKVEDIIYIINNVRGWYEEKSDGLGVSCFFVSLSCRVC